MFWGSAPEADRILALVGLAQSIATVDKLAVEGQVDETQLSPCLRAFFLRRPADLETFFADTRQLQPGITQLQRLLANSPGETEKRQLRYLLQLQYLGQQMSKRQDMMDVIAAGIDRLEQQRESLTQPELLREMGELYQRTLSKLSFRIQIQGQHGYLRDPQTASTIRAILFCGIRFASLWRQRGGSQIDFLLRKRQMRRIIGALSQGH